MAHTPKTILILGGSYGGVSIAHYLLKHVIPQLPKDEAYQVLIVSTSSRAFCRPACPRAMISDDFFDQGKLFVSIAKQFEQYPSGTFRFIQGTATKLDHVNRNVALSLSGGGEQTIDFNALVIATGASTPSPLMGLNRDEEFLRSSWAELRGALPTAKSIVIAGGGPAAVETAGELGQHLNGRAGMFSSKLENPKVAITVITSAPQILPSLRASIAEKAEPYLAQVGVTIIKDVQVMSVTPEGSGTKPGLIASKSTVVLGNGKTLEADIFIPAYGTRPNTSFIDESLLTADRRVETNSSTLRVDKAGPRIYATGDVGSHATPAIHVILASIPVLGANMKRDLLIAAGKTESEVGEDRKFVEDKRETQMVPIGKSKGVGAAMGYALPSFMVWLIKGRDYWLWTTGGLWSGKQWANES